MTKTLLLFLLLFSPIAFANEADDRKECIHTLQKYHAEKWCDSADRKNCLSLHGAEWCDGSVEAEAEGELVDQQLSDVYKKLINEVDERQRKAIRESQRAWLQYRTLECTARNEMMNGGDSVMRNNVFTGCLIEFSKSRIKEFEREY
jgi:uncharacterized protein YecT (DUF1311 family)